MWPISCECVWLVCYIEPIPICCVMWRTTHSLGANRLVVGVDVVDFLPAHANQNIKRFVCVVFLFVLTIVGAVCVHDKHLLGFMPICLLFIKVSHLSNVYLVRDRRAHSTQCCCSEELWPIIDPQPQSSMRPKTATRAAEPTADRHPTHNHLSMMMMLMMSCLNRARQRQRRRLRSYRCVNVCADFAFATMWT